MSHTPVLLNEVIEALEPSPGKFIIDGTVNGGGHSAAIWEKISPSGMLLATDWDKNILEKTRKDFESRYKLQATTHKLFFIHSSYTEIPEILKRENLPKADGLLLDLGFSSEQLEAKRGFSYRGENRLNEPLDMRYDPSFASNFAEATMGEKASEGAAPTAAEILNSYREEELSDIFWKYGEERFARRIAHGIVEARKDKRIITVGELIEAIKNSVPQFFKKGESDVTMRVFQALRIYVNKELENVERILGDLDKIVKPGGRVAIITFHSLEDRLVKNKFKELETKGVINILNKKPIIPTDEEIKQNSRSRSAKLRICIIN